MTSRFFICALFAFGLWLTPVAGNSAEIKNSHGLSAFGDLNQYGPDAFRFYTKTKTVTARWFSGIKDGAAFNFKAMD